MQVSLPTQYNGKTQDPVGALSGTLARLQANRPLRELREIAKGVTKQLPEPIQACYPSLPCPIMQASIDESDRTSHPSLSTSPLPSLPVGLLIG